MIPAAGGPRSPTRRGYLIQNPTWNAVFRAMDGLLAACLGQPRATRIGPPRRILLSNGAHLGDVVISTAVLPVLRSAFPEAEIGFLAGSWSEPVLRGHPLVARTHRVDHWRAIREPMAPAAKLRRYLSTRRRALAELRAARYDVAVELYSYFPNQIALLWQAGIPVRVGYASSGFGPLLTHALPFEHKGLHEAQYQLRLLEVLPLPAGSPERLAMVLRDPLPEGVADVSRVLEALPRPFAPYRVLHMGTSGSRRREWPPERWRVLAERLVAQGCQLLFTGLGEHEAQLAREAARGLPGCANACDRLGWEGFLAALRGAEVVYSAETSAGHIAAAYGVPVVTIRGAMHDPARWSPRGEACAVATHPVPCAPCHRREGCEGMECLREVSPEAAHRAGEALLAGCEPRRAALGRGR
ncbi:MAG: glycosyltransferase family 9 protein [Thermodesulfobacteriota bacterium]